MRYSNFEKYFFVNYNTQLIQKRIMLGIVFRVFVIILVHESRKTRRKQLAENNWSKILGRKLVEKQLAENDPTENSSQEQKIIN